MRTSNALAAAVLLIVACDQRTGTTIHPQSIADAEPAPSRAAAELEVQRAVAAVSQPERQHPAAPVVPEPPSAEPDFDPAAISVTAKLGGFAPEDSGNLARVDAAFAQAGPRMFVHVKHDIEGDVYRPSPHDASTVDASAPLHANTPGLVWSVEDDAVCFVAFDGGRYTLARGDVEVGLAEESAWPAPLQHTALNDASIRALAMAGALGEDIHSRPIEAIIESRSSQRLELYERTRNRAGARRARHASVDPFGAAAATEDDDSAVPAETTAVADAPEPTAAPVMSEVAPADPETPAAG